MNNHIALLEILLKLRIKKTIETSSKGITFAVFVHLNLLHEKYNAEHSINRAAFLRCRLWQ